MTRNFKPVLHLHWYSIRHVKFIGHQEQQKLSTLLYIWEYTGAECSPAIIPLIYRILIYTYYPTVPGISIPDLTRSEQAVISDKRNHQITAIDKHKIARNIETRVSMR